jgi:arginyl-tRNA synthetase
MKNPWLSLKQEIAKELGAKIEEIEEPDKFGDFAYACFSLAKETKRNPNEIAKELAEKIKMKFIEKVNAIGTYVNFYINWPEFTQEILKSVDKKYGSCEEKETVMMDVFQPNPFKPFHIGHIRNAVIGESIRRLLEFCGKKTIAVSYMGDVGTHVAKWFWYFNNFYKGEIPKENVSKWAGEIYSKATQKMEEKEEYEKEVQEINRKLDSRDKKLMKAWKKLRDLCLEDFWKIQKELDVHLDGHFYESESEIVGKSMVNDLIKKGVAEVSEGAPVINLEKYGLGVFLLMKSDGTSLYSTKDLGLYELKRKKYKFDKSVFIVAAEQYFYFKQLFKAFEVLNLPGWEKNIHISFGLVTLKEGKMSSRYGTIILYEDLRDEMIKKILDEIEKKNPDLKDKYEIAKKIAFGAIKYSMLDIDNDKSIKFDWEQVLDIEGRSGPYLQYSLVRALSILKKAKIERYDPSLLKEDIELKLIKKLAKFPNIIKNAAAQYSPNILTTYLFELAQDFNSFYQSLPVLKAEKELKKARLKLVEAFTIVIKSGLNLLSISILEKM